MFSKQVTSIEQTHRLAGLLAENLRGGEIIGLRGGLGAGKTEFVRGVASALGISPAEVNSPSYVLEHIYPVGGRAFNKLSHWDLYRLDSDSAPEELFDYESDSSSVLLVEWPDSVEWLEKILSFLIEIRVPESAGSQREFLFQGCNEYWQGVFSK